MISIPIETVEAVIYEKAMLKELNSWIAKGKTKLKALKDETVDQDEIDYLDKLISQWNTLVKAHPDTLEANKANYILPHPKNKKLRVAFKDKVLGAGGYEEMRSQFFPEYFRKIGIKACVYCNSQLAVSTDGIKTIKRKVNQVVNARFQLDHFIDKAKYPCFSICLFNLNPVCASCNNSKSNYRIQFDLYVANANRKSSPFIFLIDKKRLAAYLMNWDPAVLDFDFIEGPYNDPNIRTFKDTFDIEGIYRTQIDILEEMIIRHKIYTEKYIESLREAFEDILDDPSLFDRIIMGNYTNANEIHKRPMAKFMQDMTRQLELLVKKNT